MIAMRSNALPLILEVGLLVLAVAAAAATSAVPVAVYLVSHPVLCWWAKARPTRAKVTVDWNNMMGSDALG